MVTGDKEAHQQTLGDLLAAVNLGNLLLEQLVALLADVDNLSARDAELRHGSQDLLADLGGGLVLGQSIRVAQRVIWRSWSASAIVVPYTRSRDGVPVVVLAG